jgi:hypothetical protein
MDRAFVDQSKKHPALSGCFYDCSETPLPFLYFSLRGTKEGGGFVDRSAHPGARCVR